MTKRSLTAILGTIVLVGGLSGYLYADIQDAVPGFLTKTPPKVGAEVPQRESVQPIQPLPARMLSDVPPIVPGDLNAAWDSFTSAGSERNFKPAAYVVDAMTGNVLLNGNGEKPSTPASTLKILTAYSAVQTLDVTDTLATSLYLDEDAALHLIGEGDLMLAEAAGDKTEVNGRAGLQDLARAAVANLKSEHEGTTVTKLVFHPRIFEGETREATLPEALQQWVGNNAAFAINRGEMPGAGYQPYWDNPGLKVAEALQEQLADAGLEVEIEQSDQAFDATDAEKVAEVNSAIISEVTRYMLSHSDNTLAEQLCRLSAAHADQGSTFADATANVESVIASSGIYTEGLKMLDCSGLNEDNLVAPRTIVETLRETWDSPNPAVRGIMRDLPIGQFTGTLNSRFYDEMDAVRIQAKTGSLDTVSSLAGFVTTKEGRVLIFHVQTSTSDEESAYFTRDAIEDFTLKLVNL